MQKSNSPAPAPRDLVFQLLLRWTDPASPPFLPERSDPDWAKLSPRDRPFAYDLLTGILRWRAALDAVIASQLKQPIDILDQSVRAALWLGTYQILFQGTADYAAVDTAVTLARRANPKTGGLVNAILRNITRLEPRRSAIDTTLAPAARLSRRSLALDFETDLHFNANIFPDPVKAPISHLAAVRSHPNLYVERLRKMYPEQAADILLRNNQRPLVTLRVDADAHEAPAAAGLAAHASEPRFLVALEGWNDFIEQRVAAGTLSPQDPTAAKPVRHLASLIAQNALPAPTHILDYCAGLGTKTVQLARTFPDAQITATDIDTVKLARLDKRVKQLKLKNVQTLPLTEIETPKSETKNPPEPSPLNSKPSLILLDVPCSNTGVFAKRVQSRWRWPTLDHAGLAALQLQLLTQAAALLAPGGLLIYATCSIDPAENTLRIAEFLAKNPTFQKVAETLTLPSLAGPPNAPCDGGYFALLRQA